jgi:hypothetical protein
VHEIDTLAVLDLAGNEDGMAESIWDRFVHTPGTIRNDDTGDVATGAARRGCRHVLPCAIGR